LFFGLSEKKKTQRNHNDDKENKKVLKKNGKAVVSWEFKFDGQINLSS